MMKNTMIKVFSVLAVALCMTACSNDGGTSDKSVTTTTSDTSITTTGPVVTTTVATVTNEPEEVVTTSSSSEDTNTITEPTTTSDVGSESTTTVTTTVTTTTPKATTTKKPTTVTTTTTKKKATTTTTTKKKTTTTTTTPKPTTTPEVTTTTTAFVPLITQDEIDKLVAELQEYSNSKETYMKNNMGEWSKQEYGNYEGYYAYRVATLTPENSSWGAPTTINPEIHDYKTAYDMMIKFIDFIYNDVPDCHIVIYAKYYPNGITGNESSYSWEIYRLH